MSKVHIFKDNQAQCFFNVSLDNGDRIYVSVAQTGLLVWKMKWMGMVKDRELFRCDKPTLVKMLVQLSGDNLPPAGVTPLQMLLAAFGGQQSANDVADALMATKLLTEHRGNEAT